MKKKWEEIWKQLEDTDGEIAVFLETAGLSSLGLKQAAKFIKEWNSLKKMTSEFDKYISPVEPIEVKSKFKSESFKEMWQRWKEYLSEQHGQIMRTRSEVSALEHLADIAKGNDEKAIIFLRYAMTNRYKNFFAIEEKDIKQPPKSQSNDSDY